MNDATLRSLAYVRGDAMDIARHLRDVTAVTRDEFLGIANAIDSLRDQADNLLQEWPHEEPETVPAKTGNSVSALVE